jgi:hypothetical protein
MSKGLLDSPLTKTSSCFSYAIWSHIKACAGSYPAPYVLRQHWICWYWWRSILRVIFRACLRFLYVRSRFDHVSHLESTVTDTALVVSVKIQLLPFLHVCHFQCVFIQTITVVIFWKYTLSIILCFLMCNFPHQNCVQ